MGTPLVATKPQSHKATKPQIIEFVEEAKCAIWDNIGILARMDVGKTYNGVRVAKRAGSNARRHITVIALEQAFCITQTYIKRGTQARYIVNHKPDFDTSDANFGAAMFAADKPFSDCDEFGSDEVRRGWLNAAGTDDYELKSHTLGDAVTIKLCGCEIGYDIQFVLDDSVEVEEVDDPNILAASRAFDKAVSNAKETYRLVFGADSIDAEEIEYDEECPY